MKAAAACACLAAAASALAADPYPDQPGALSASELRAATAAMSALPGADAKLPLIASGERAAVAYAVFARAPRQVAPILSTQQRVLCVTSSSAQWTCASQLFHRFAQGRLVQSFAYSARGVAEDPQMPFKIVAWAGRCFGPQYAEKTGKPPPPGMPAIAEVVQDAKRVIVTTGAGEAYELSEPAPEPGQTCPFALQALGTSAALVSSPEMQTPQRAEAAAQPLEGRPPSPVVHPALVWVLRAALLLCALAGIAALVLPFVVRRVRGRRAAAAASTLLTAATVAGAIAAIVANRFAGVSHAARSVSFIVPLTGLALASCVVWTVIGILAARPKPKKA